MTPSQKIQAVLNGTASLDTLDAAERSNIRLMIYHRACDALTFENPKAIAREIERQPETIREAVRSEARRLYQHRGHNKSV